MARWETSLLAVLRHCPIRAVDLSFNDRKRLGNCCRLGWAVTDGKQYVTTKEGDVLLASRLTPTPLIVQPREAQHR